MAGNKTHEQQQAVIEKRVNTKNADRSFDAEADLKMSAEEKVARERGHDLDTHHEAGTTDPDDRSILRGMDWESEHSKKRAES